MKISTTACLIGITTIIAGCAGPVRTLNTESRAVDQGPPYVQARLNKIYVEPGPVAINGGVRPVSVPVSPHDPFVTDYVLRRPVASDYDASVKLIEGGRLPDQIRLFDVPSTGYAYTMINGRLVLVDPNRRRIVRVF